VRVRHRWGGTGRQLSEQWQQVGPGILGAGPGWITKRSAAASNNKQDVMPAIRSQLSLTLTESAVAETVRRVNAQALALLTRRVEINRRIRSLHRVVQGLRDLAASHSYPAELAAPGLTALTLTTERTNEESETRNDKSSHKSRHKPTIGRMRFGLPSRSQHESAALSRACRIALMEAESPASLDEIRSRIDRRGSFAFHNSEFANVAITRTLNVMRDSGEARCVTSCETSGLPSFWQRIPPPAEIDG
jgi:hypothetical protein